jgi:hypothetical protein
MTFYAKETRGGVHVLEGEALGTQQTGPKGAV